jgi:MFS family permease
VPRLVRDRLTWLTYAQLAVWCYFLYGFGPVVPLLRDEQHTSRTVAGLHGTALALGAIIGGAIIPELTRRLGRNRLIWFGLAGVSLATGGLLVSHALALTLTFATAASLSGGFVVNGVVAALTEHHGVAGSASISEANAAAAATGLVAPLVIGASVGVGLGWRVGLAGVMVLAAALGVVVLLTGVRAPEPIPVSTVDGRRNRPLPRAFRLAFVSIFATGSVEICLSLWAADVLRTRAHVSPSLATAALSAILAGMLAGRLAGGPLVLRFRQTRVLLGALAVSAGGFAVFWLATAPWLALVGLVLCGLGNSLHYPLGIALAVAHSDGQPDLAAARAAYAIGIAFGVAPFLLGAIADGVGPHLAFLLLPGFLAASAVAVFRLDASGGGAEPGTSAPAGDRDAVGDRQQHRVDPVVGGHHVVELVDRTIVGGLGREDPAAA